MKRVEGGHGGCENVKNVELSGAARKFRVESFPAMQALHEHGMHAARIGGNRGVKA